MSALPVYQIRRERAAAAAAAARPRLEVVTTRSQRAARPRSFYATVAVLSVFALFLAQLMLSILLSDGAYQISSLQAQQTTLARSEQALSEQLDLLGSPQNLAAKAEALGMVVGTSTPVFLRLSDGAVIGTVNPASGTVGAIGASGGLVPNAALDASTVTEYSSPDAPTIATAEGAPALSTAPASVPSKGGVLPSPNTR